MVRFYVDFSDLDKPVTVCAFPMTPDRFNSVISNKFPACCNAAIRRNSSASRVEVDSNLGTVPYMLLMHPYSNKQSYVDAAGQIQELNQPGMTVGLRPEIFVVYSAKSCVTRTLRKQQILTIIIDPSSHQPAIIRGEYPVVTFGGNDYIWLNLDSCKHGQQYMDLYSIDCLDAIPNADLGATKFMTSPKTQTKYLLAVTKKCSDEEKELLVNVELDVKDGQINLVPNFTPEQWDIMQNKRPHVK